MENNYRAEIRFRFYHYIFYTGGVPLFYTAVSNLYRVYSFLCHVCFHMLLVAMFMDIYHRHMLDTAMAFAVFFGECCTI